jgi:hypothetical protein
MANQQHLNMLKKGADVWNSWVKSNGVRPDLEDADLKGMNLSGYRFKEAILKGAKLNRANLHKAKLDNAYLRRANLTGAELSWASLSGANLRHAVLRNANLTRAYLRRADLSYVDLSGADLTGSVLEYARLVDVNLDGATLRDCLIYGASVWNIIGTPKEQSNLVITPGIASRSPATPRGQAEPKITVDDLEVAQFIYLLLNHQKLRNTLNSVTERGVLLLGRFGDGGLPILHAVAAKLRELGYLPIIFDFERPEMADYTSTVRTLAGLSRFVIVDLSGPAVPQELQAIVPDINIPYVPIIEEGRKVYSMFVDLLKYDWVVRPVLEFASEEQLLELLPSKIIAPAEQKYERRKELLKELFG